MIAGLGVHRRTLGKEGSSHNVKIMFSRAQVQAYFLKTPLEDL